MSRGGHWYRDRFTHYKMTEQSSEKLMTPADEASLPSSRYIFWAGVGQFDQLRQNWDPVIL